MLRREMRKSTNAWIQGRKARPRFLIGICWYSFIKPTDLSHLRVQATDFHGAPWTDTTSASGSGTVGCSPNKDTQYRAGLLSRAQSLYCSQFPRLLAKYNWQELLLLSAGFPFPSPLPTIPCVKHHSHYLSVRLERSNLFTSTYSFLDQCNVIVSCSPHPTSINPPLYLTAMAESLKTHFTKNPIVSHRFFPWQTLNKSAVEPCTKRKIKRIKPSLVLLRPWCTSSIDPCN